MSCKQQKAISLKPLREGMSDSPGSKSMACDQSWCINVGDPKQPPIKGYQPTSVKARELKGLRGSQMGRSTVEAG